MISQYKIGLDPAAISFWMDTNKYLHKGDAKYVQTIGTSLFGTSLNKADSDIDIQHNCPWWNLHHNHRLAAYLHEIIAAKKATLIASEKNSGKGRIVKYKPDSSPNISVAKNECIIGIYNQNVSLEAQRKQYVLKLSWDDCKTIDKLSLEPKSKQDPSRLKKSISSMFSNALSNQ